VISGLSSLRFLTSFLREPILATRKLHAENGPFVRLDYPLGSRKRPRSGYAIADAELLRSMLSATDTWRNVKISFTGLPNHASKRLNMGMTRLRGARHEHYRKLIAAPLKKPAIAAMAPEMARLADDLVRQWPREVELDLPEHAKGLATVLAVGLLFGADIARARPISDLITEHIASSWFIPGMALAKWLPKAAEQERLILEWAAEKRGDLDARDLLSVLVNNPDESGEPPSTEIIVGIMTFLFGAAYDTCQNALTWALVLLTQHPEIADRLATEIDDAFGGDLPTAARLAALPLLDGVTREAMRLMPPVPLQFRKSLAPTTLGGCDIETGTRVLVSAHLINRNPAIYPDPDRFVPDRWPGLNPSPFDYPVFGAGAHMCPGVTFGYQMMKIALATIVAHHKVELSPSARVGYRTAITLTATGRVGIVLRPRRGAHRGPALVGKFRQIVALP
jgi:cytochrome P450